MNYKIYEPNLKPLLAKLDRLNGQLIKIGGLPVLYNVTGFVDERHPDDASKVVRYFKLDVTGEAPVQNDWEFVATLVHTDEGNIIRSVPGYTVPDAMRDRPTQCDHCNVNRNRHDTYVVRSRTDASKVMQVGSSCLSDFIGVPAGRLTKAVTHLLNAFDICDAATRREWLGGSASNAIYRIDLETFLSTVAAVVLKDGRYVTRKQANEGGQSATSDKARSAMERQGLTPYAVTPEAAALAESARNWVVNSFSPALPEPVDGDSDEETLRGIMNSLTARNADLTDFQHNLLACARSESIEPRLCGIAAYIIEAYRRQLPKPEAARLDTAGMSRIHSMFVHAKDSQLKYPGIRLATPDGQKVSLAPAGIDSRNAGCIYVKGGTGVYYGKIAADGSFYPVASAPAAVGALLLAFAAEPEKVAGAYGKRTGCCCFCNRKLTDARSTAVGYGEVCAEKFNLEYPVHTATASQVLEIVCA